MGTDTPLNTNTHPDYIAIALVAAIAIIVVVLVIRKYLSNKNASISAEVTEKTNETACSSAQLAPGSAGNIKLNNVSPKTAAMIMAIVADELGKPLNELRFISVKEITNDEV